MNKVKNHLLFLLYTVILGMIVGAIVWGFLRVMNLGIDFLWSFLPSQISFPLYTLCVCALGGLLIGLWKRKFGDYPEELGTVLGTVKKTGGYPYRNVFSTLGSALFPLLIGASVGPEAGLTGVIAGLCTWVGDKLKRFKREVEDLTAIGLSATLGTVFRSPMFGFVEPIESDKDTVLPKTSKIVLYFTAILSYGGGENTACAIFICDPAHACRYRGRLAVLSFQKTDRSAGKAFRKICCSARCHRRHFVRCFGNIFTAHHVFRRASDRARHGKYGGDRRRSPDRDSRDKAASDEYLYEPAVRRQCGPLCGGRDDGACRSHPEKAAGDRAFADDRFSAEAHPCHALRVGSIAVHPDAETVSDRLFFEKIGLRLPERRYFAASFR